MKEESSRHPAKARESLDEARQIFAISLLKPAARSAYYAAFHCAQAYIFEQTSKIAKTHSGVRSEFARLLQSNQEFEQSHKRLLANGYRYKEISDYCSDPTATITTADCSRLIEGAERFLTDVTATLK